MQNTHHSNSILQLHTSILIPLHPSSSFFYCIPSSRMVRIKLPFIFYNIVLELNSLTPIIIKTIVRDFFGYVFNALVLKY
ncbi:hypothetical protein RJT34_05475 [Clitoria ternatea]|uniref:Uncharacterized protein n=1 Tax=Clitoria ternatea TaxID=43366 RepID=A0AAN9PSL9_CLITE